MTRVGLDRIAVKLHWLKSQGGKAAAARLANPAYREALCFVQAMSSLPGGLEKFAADFLARSGQRIDGGQPGSAPSDGLVGTPGGTSASSEKLARALQSWLEEGADTICGDVVWSEFEGRYPNFLNSTSSCVQDYAQGELAKTADTTLRRKVFFELEFARLSAPPIPMTLVADTRHGKTVAIETYCRAWPGRARLVTVPESNRERDFYAAYAEAFGIGFNPKTPIDVLRNLVAFTLQNAGVFTVHDEAHFLVPINYSEQTPPQRLNWVRHQILDRHLPCAFFCTPQSQNETLRRYVQRTHYNMEQWLGRMPKPVLIEESPGYEDLMAVARNWFPEFPQVVLDELCDGATERAAGADRLGGEGGFKIVEQAGARARFLASQARTEGVTLTLMKEALDWAGVPPLDVESPGAMPKSGEDFLDSAPVPPNSRGASVEAPHRDRAGRATPGRQPILMTS